MSAKFATNAVSAHGHPASETRVGSRGDGRGSSADAGRGDATPRRRRGVVRGDDSRGDAAAATLMIRGRVVATPRRRPVKTSAGRRYAAAGAPHRGAALFERCVNGEAGHPVPNQRLLTAGVSSYARLGDANKAFEVVRSSATNVDARLGNALLAAAAAARDVRRAEAVFAAMTRPGDVAEPDQGDRVMPSFSAPPRAQTPRAPAAPLADAVTYRTMIDAYAAPASNAGPVSAGSSRRRTAGAALVRTPQKTARPNARVSRPQVRAREAPGGRRRRVGDDAPGGLPAR